MQKGTFGVEAMQKRWSIDRRMMYTGQWEYPPGVKVNLVPMIVTPGQGPGVITIVCCYIDI